MFKKTLFLLLSATIALSACGTVDVRLEPTPFLTGTPSAAPLPSAAVASTKMYANPKYGFSLEYPISLTVNPSKNDDSVYIGETIQIQVSDRDPLACRGDCPVVETKGPATIAGFEMTKVTGYIGSIGGNIPQKYLRYVLKKDRLYYIFTLYALSFRTTIKDPTKKWPLGEKDILLFNQMLKSFQFTSK